MMEFRISSVIYPIDRLKKNFLYTRFQLLEQVLSPVFSCVFDLSLWEKFHLFSHPYFMLQNTNRAYQMQNAGSDALAPPVEALGSVHRKKIPGIISLLVSVIRNTGLRGLW
jgi:hypothetical protein